MRTVGKALRCQFGISSFPIRESSIKASSAELTARSAALLVLSYQLMGAMEFRDYGTAPEDFGGVLTKANRGLREWHG
jgi:hypothetical protein